MRSVLGSWWPFPNFFEVYRVISERGAAKGMQVPPKASKAQDLHLTPSVPSDTE